MVDASKVLTKMAQSVLNTANIFAKVYIDFYLPSCTKDDDDSWYTLPISELCTVADVPAGHVKLVISEVHNRGNAEISDPISRENYMPPNNLLSYLQSFDCYPLASLRFANIENWDYRFNCFLSFLQTRTRCIEFDDVQGPAYMTSLHSLVLVNGQSFLQTLSLKGYSHKIQRSDMVMFLDAASRIPNLWKLHLDARLDSGYSPELCSELCARIALMKNLDELQLCGGFFDNLGNGSSIADILYYGTKEAKVRSIAVKSYSDEIRAKQYVMSFSALQECVCGESAKCLEEIHLHRVLVTENRRATAGECEGVRVLDLKKAFGSPSARIAQDLLGLFPKLVYCRLDYCCIASFQPFAGYIESNKLLREVHLVGNRLDNKDYFIVLGELKKWKNLRVLNLKRNPVAVTNAMRDKLADELEETRLEQFIWEHNQWECKWEGDWKRLTGALCIHQMYNFLEDKRVGFGGEIPDYMWPGIFQRASRMGQWENATRNYIDNSMEYRGNMYGSWYKASLEGSRVSDVLCVVNWLLLQPYATAMACGGFSKEGEANLLDTNRKRKRIEIL